MNKSYDYNNSNNFWQPNNSYNNQNLPSQQSSLLRDPAPPTPSMFSQTQYGQSQQMQSRTGEGTNSGYNQTENENVDMVSKRNVSYPLPNQEHHSSCGSKGRPMPRETTNRTGHNAFPPPNPVISSNFNHSETETMDPINEGCPTPNWSYRPSLSRTDGLNRKPVCNELNSYNMQNMNFDDQVSNSYVFSNQHNYQGQPNNDNSSQSYSNYLGNNTMCNTPESYEFNFKPNLPNRPNSAFLNSHENQRNRPDRPIPSTSLTNFEREYDGVVVDAENDSNNENRTSDVNENNAHHYNSPLDVLESTRGNNNKLSSFHSHTKDINSIIPDNRRPPPIEIDPNLPQEIAALFKTSSCDLCGVKLNSRLQAKMHYEGRPHGKKIRQAVNDMENKANPSSSSDTDSLPPKKKKAVADVNQLYCKCCDLSLTSTNHATQHYMGRNHHRVLHGLKPLQAGYYNKETGQWQRTPPDPITSTEQIGLDDKDDLIAESVKHKGKFFCELCGVAATSKEQLEGHLVGQKHTKKLKALKQAELAEVSAAEGSNQNSDGESGDGKTKKKSKIDGKPKRDFLSKAQEAIRSLFESAGTPIDGEEDLFKTNVPEPTVSVSETVAEKSNCTKVVQPRKPEVFTRKVHKEFLNQAKDSIKSLFENVLHASDDSLTNNL